MTRWEPSPRTVALIALVALIAGLTGITRSQIAVNKQLRIQLQTEATNQAFCNTIRLFVDPSLPPPTTERGRQQIANMRDQYKVADCAHVPVKLGK